MNKSIPVPEECPEHLKESYREFVVAKEVLQLLVDRGVFRFQGMMIVSYVMVQCGKQINEPEALQECTQKLIDMTANQLEGEILKQLRDPGTQVRMKSMDRMTRKFALNACVKDELVMSIKDTDFIMDTEEQPAPEPPSPIILAR